MVNPKNITKPLVLAISAHDPTGGAGSQADMESIIANRCQPISVISALTEQSLAQGVISITPQSPENFHNQLQSVTKEYSVSAVKIGVLPSKEHINSVIQILVPLKLPIVLDPVIKASSGFDFNSDEINRQIMNDLAPVCYCMTPNLDEAKILSDRNNLSEAAEVLIQSGCKNILITTSKKTDKYLEHTLYSDTGEFTFQYPNLPGEYHGSGCTLSSAIAAQITLTDNIKQAMKNALDYTWETLDQAYIQKNNVYLPNRLFNIFL